MEHGLEAEAQNLIQNEADIGIGDNEGQQPLYLACVEGFTRLVTLLLSKGSIVNAATYYGYEKVVSLLLEKNADLYIKDDADWTLLMTATRMQRPEIVRMILHQKDRWKEDYLEIRDELDLTPLHVASMEGSHEITSQLINARANCDSRWRGSGGDVNFEAGPGWTPLHFASFYNHPKIVALLLPKTPVPGVDVNAEADNGRTPLHLASLQGNEFVVKALFQKKASIDATDKRRMTLLHLASGANAEDRCLSDPDPVSPGPSGEDDPDWEKRVQKRIPGDIYQSLSFNYKKEPIQ
ncbi:hypothetical protein ACKAV7_013935 [Fusarium commune]